MKTLTLDTGISDQHELIVSMLSSTFAKSKPKTMSYFYYKGFDNKHF